MSTNIYHPTFDEERDQKAGFICQRARIGQQVGSQKLGVSLWQLPPGETAYPYHFHLSEEEMLIVLKGNPQLRSSNGVRELAEGEVVLFLPGEEGSHQIMNRSDQTIEFLAISTNGEPDIVVYPDSNKLGAYERRSDGTGLREMFKLATAVDYYEGEEPPAES